MYSAILTIALTTGTAEAPGFFLRRCCDVCACPTVACPTVVIPAVYPVIVHPPGMYIWGPYWPGVVWYDLYATYPVVPMHPNMTLWYRPMLPMVHPPHGPAAPPPPKVKPAETKDEKKKVAVPESSERSVVTVKLPAGGQLLVDGQPAPLATPEANGSQIFRTPALATDTLYKYTFVMEIMKDGAKATQRQVVEFRPGEPITLDFVGGDKVAGK